ncbi:MAG: acyl-CoA thioesterase, partial [Rhodocyclaceae bacterium]|nr:acyl-CoA thioesterase [Rhodocyclaceae bacterium]
ATVAVNSFLFKQPVSVVAVSLKKKRVVKEGRTSITVDVEVFAERHPENPLVVKVTEAQLTYVAVDSNGEKRALPAP